MKLVIFVALTMLLFACKQTAQQKIDTFLKHHLEPTEKKDNKMKVGETIIFGYSETQGIDRERYPAPTYSDDMDTAFFKFVKSESFDDGASGGFKSIYEIYKVVKAGVTKIERFKNSKNYQEDIKEKVATYNFVITE
jgi:hypothetical protein